MQIRGKNRRSFASFSVDVIKQSVQADESLLLNVQFSRWYLSSRIFLTPYVDRWNLERYDDVTVGWCCAEWRHVPSKRSRRVDAVGALSDNLWADIVARLRAVFARQR